jgi:hypothetical protein
MGGGNACFAGYTFPLESEFLSPEQVGKNKQINATVYIEL